MIAGMMKMVLFACRKYKKHDCLQQNKVWTTITPQQGCQAQYHFEERMHFERKSLNSTAFGRGLLSRTKPLCYLYSVCTVIV